VNKNIYRIIVVISITLVSMYIIFQYTTIADIIDSISKINLKTYIFVFFIHMSAYFLRSGALYFFSEKSINYIFLLSVHFIQNFVAQILPMGLGEFSMPLLLKKRVSLEKGINLLVVSKIQLLLINTLLFIISVVFVFNSNPLKEKSIMIAIIITGFSIFTIYGLFKISNKLYARNINNKILKIIVHFIVGFSNYLRNMSLTNWLLSSAFLLLSVIPILLFYGILLNSLSFELSVWELILFSTIGIAGLIIPIRAIGGFGTFEGLWVLALVLIGYNDTEALEAGFTIHIIALINQLVFFTIGVMMYLLFRKKKQIL